MILEAESQRPWCATLRVLRTSKFSQRPTKIIASGASEPSSQLVSSSVRPALVTADLDNSQFAIYKMMPFASSSDVTRQRLHVEDRPDRSWGGARATNVWLTRDFPGTFRLRGCVALLAIDG